MTANHSPCQSKLGCEDPAARRGLCVPCYGVYKRNGWQMPLPSTNAPGKDRLPRHATRPALTRTIAYLDNRHLLGDITHEELARKLELDSVRGVERYARYARWLDDHVTAKPWVRAAASEDPMVSLTIWDYTAAFYTTNEGTPEPLTIAVLPEGATSYRGTVSRAGEPIGTFIGERARTGVVSKLRWPLNETIISKHLLDVILDNTPVKTEDRKRKTTSHLALVPPPAHAEPKRAPEQAPAPAVESEAVEPETPAESAPAVPYRDPREETAGILAGLVDAPDTHKMPEPPSVDSTPERTAALARIYKAAADAGFPFAQVTVDDIRAKRVPMPPEVRAAIRAAIADMDDTFVAGYIGARRILSKAAASA
ncbi:hypothetical protein ACQP25_44840 (plasmid) [Microtetraspora malaysiensis]|uniref:hypothetical protein n=1 Tax=Microtetraspora malaysiensis TaxID=161358 RepID=UPI003D8E9562